MSKTVLASHIIGERGVNAFADYCNRHKPYIIWREETKNDFGVDGEIELTEITLEGKTKPTSQIIKIQIKSTQHDNSYMTRETSDSFSFNASEADMEYWKNYRQYGYQVLLVIFDGRAENDHLYCKQISDIDVGLTTKKGKQKSQPIEFSKIENKLAIGQNDFLDRYRSSFKGRVNQQASETLDSNLWPFTSEPRILYTYPTHFKTKKDIFIKINSNEAPYFVIYNSIIYTFTPIERVFKKFFEHVVSEGHKRTEHSYREIIDSVSLRNHYVELLNEYIKDFMRTRSLHYQRHFRRYYFYLKSDQIEYKVPFRTRKKSKETEKVVAKEFQYGPNHFFRHLAIEVKCIFVESRVYMIASPKYYFSSDRKAAWDSKKTTQYTNFLNARTFNDGVLDELHFWWQHLARGEREITIFDGSALNQPSIIIGSAIWFPVKFGVSLNGPKLETKRKVNTSKSLASSQISLSFE
jgi:hypothetical protein